MPFELPVRVYWEDTDAGGIVYHANYLKYCERARSAWLSALGWQQSTLQTTLGGLFVVSDASLKFIQPARLDDELVATAAVASAGRAALEFAQHIWRRDAAAPHQRPALHQPQPPAGCATLLCSARVRVGWVNANTYKPGRIPPELIERLHA